MRYPIMCYTAIATLLCTSAVVVSGQSSETADEPLFPSAANERLATVIYVEGAPQLARNGEVVPNPVDFGFELQDHDLLETGADGLVELSVYPRVGIAGRITAQADTVLAFDMIAPEPSPTLRAEAEAVERRLHVFRGSVSVDLAGMSEGAAFTVQTPSVHVSVRGTDFTVDVALTGAIVVSSVEGVVELAVPGGRRLFAQPGMVAYYRPAQELLRNVSVPGSRLSAFRRGRRANARAELRGNTEAVVQGLLREYRSARDEFSAAYAAVMTRRGILDAWVEAHRRRRGIPNEELRGQLGRIEEALADGITALRRFESVFYRAEGVHELLGDNEGESYTALAQQLAADRELYRRRMRVLRYMRKLQNAAARAVYTDGNGVRSPGVAE